MNSSVFIRPEAELIYFAEEDIIRTSQESGGGNPNETDRMPLSL